MAEKKLEVFFASMIEKPVVTLYSPAAETITAEEVQSSLVEHYNFLANATFTDVEDDDGNRTIVFTEKYGTKG
jgi:hypothetical protein